MSGVGSVPGVSTFDVHDVQASGRAVDPETTESHSTEAARASSPLDPRASKGDKGMGLRQLVYVAPLSSVRTPCIDCILTDDLPQDLTYCDG
jgi:hypothetical protein